MSLRPCRCARGVFATWYVVCIGTWYTIKPIREGKPANRHFSKFSSMPPALIFLRCFWNMCTTLPPSSSATRTARNIDGCQFAQGCSDRVETLSSLAVKVVTFSILENGRTGGGYDGSAKVFVGMWWMPSGSGRFRPGARV